MSKDKKTFGYESYTIEELIQTLQSRSDKKYGTLEMEYNPHKLNYESVLKYFERFPDQKELGREEERQRCIDLESLWILSWYPKSREYGYESLASSLREALLQLVIMSDNS